MNIELIKNLASMKEPRLFNYLKRFLIGHYGKTKVITDKEDEWMIAIGEIPVVLCAHLDTVFDNPPINIFVDKEAQVMWAPAGLGADDRAGVYAIMSLILDGYMPSVLFTTGEEMGCMGAKKLVSTIPYCPIYRAKCLIQLDRRNNAESVYYSCGNKKFENWINSFGFDTALGTFTDISILCPIWEIAGVNLSVGYYNEHSCQEFLRYNELEQTINKVKRIMADAHNVNKFVYIKNPEAANWPNNLVTTCDFCMTPLTKDYYEIQDSGYTYNLCPDCMNYYDKTFKFDVSPQDS